MNVCEVKAKIKSVLSIWIRPESLTFQLTLGLTLAITLSLAGMIWGSWMLQQGSMQSYEQTLDSLATSIVQNMAMADSADRSDHALQLFVDRWSSPITWLWLKQNDHSMVAKSEAIRALPPNMQTALMSMQSSSSQMLHYSSAERHLLIKAEAVPMEQQDGQLFIAQDVTAFYGQWMTQTRQMAIAAFLYLVITVLVLVALLRRSLRPLRQIHQWVNCTESAQPTSRYLKQLPDEVRELVLSYHQLFRQVSANKEHQRQFTNQISHELRTPLSLIYGYLQSLLKRSTNLSHAQQEALKVATEETEHTIQILQDLLNIERVHSLFQPLQQEALDLNLVITDVARLATKLIYRSIQITLEESPVLITSDYNCLIQLLLYLIEQVACCAPTEQVIHLQLKQNEGVIIAISLIHQETNQKQAASFAHLKLSIAHSLAKKTNSKVVVKTNSNCADVLQVMLTKC